jgi:site-specific recombinase XerD
MGERVGKWGRLISPATVVKHYRHPKQLFRWLPEDEYRPDNPMAGIKQPKVTDKPVRVISRSEIESLIKRASLRDQAIIRLFTDTGMRASELCPFTGRC